MTESWKAASACSGAAILYGVCEKVFILIFVLFGWFFFVGCLYERICVCVGWFNMKIVVFKRKPHRFASHLQWIITIFIILKVFAVLSSFRDFFHQKRLFQYFITQNKMSSNFNVNSNQVADQTKYDYMRVIEIV